MAKKTKPSARRDRSQSRKPSRTRAKPSGNRAGGATLAGISSDAVQEATGKGWYHWLRALDKAGAKAWDHKSIAEYAHETLKIGPWWSQMVTVGYEQARGLRVKHQKAGGFSVSASKTIDRPAANAFRAFADAALRKRWLGGDSITIRKATKPRSLRITWDADQTNVDVNIYPKGATRCQVAVQHDKLPSAAKARSRKAFWAGRVEALKRVLET